MILSISGLPFIYIHIYIFFNEIELIYSVVLTSAAQRSDAVTHVNSFESFSIILYHRVSNRVPWSIQ